MTKKDDMKKGVCPICGTELMRMFGEGWDWDHAICPESGCDYDVELDVMTCHEPDGTVHIIHKENIEE